MKKTAITIVVLAVLGAGAYAALFFYQPEQAQVVQERVQKAVESVEYVAPVPQKSPLEQARAELAAATHRLEAEEMRIRQELYTATSSAAQEIKNIETERDATVERLETELAKINEVRASF